MNNSICIDNNSLLKGRWIKVNIPYDCQEAPMAFIQLADGTVLKQLFLSSGNNSIDISGINEQVINLKVETPYETILKEIQII